MKVNLISVVIPIHKIQKNFSKVRQQIHLATTAIEVIYVIDDKLGNDILQTTTSNEHIIRVHNLGRGYMFKEGIAHIKGDVILFLHSDTQLPKNWDSSIIHAMEDEKVIGGGFSLQFDIDNFYLTLSLKMIAFIVKFRKILSGDRAIFLRFQPFKKYLQILDVPIMEDIKLSQWMRTHGKVIILKESVVTSADAFIKNGFLHQSWKIIKCMLWHKIGGDPKKIYSYYYS